MTNNITRTIVQNLDDEGNTISETVTTVETWDTSEEESPESYGMYL